jgi:membrane protease YdiL (CAAX protease family)
MKNRRVFYHVGGRIGKLLQMDEPKDSLRSGFDEASPASASSGISAEPPPPFAPMKLSPFEAAMQKIFIGQSGLRAIWRLLIYLIIFRGLRFCLFVLLAYGLPDLSFLWRQTAAEFGLAIIAIVPALLMAKIEGRSFGSYGLPFRDAFGKLFWVGAAWGLVSLTILLVALRGAHAFYFGTIALHGLRVLKFAVFWAGFFLIVGFYEEFFTRGYTQFTLTDGVGFWPAAILLSLGFGALHLENPGESWVGILGAVVIGFFFCLTLRRTGNLWFAIGFHMSWDWGESFLYSVPDSGGVAPGHLLHSSLQGPRWLTGGSVGPEGSVFLFVLLAVMWVAFDRVYRDVKYPPEEIEDSSATVLNK